MPLADFLKVLDSIRAKTDSGRVMLALTGGEPLLRRDLEECGREFAARGFPWGMVSNGYALTEQRLSRLLKSGLRSITISLDGLEPSHNWLRGNENAYVNAVRAIGAVVTAGGIAFDIVTCVNQKNIAELPKIGSLLVTLGVKQWRLFNIFPRGRACGNPLLDVTPDQFTSLLEFIKHTRKEGKINASYSCEGFLGSYEGEVRDYLFFCRAGINIGSVLSNGSISACPSLRGDYIQGNIYTDDFCDVWEKRFQIMRDRKWTKTGECLKCKVYAFCEGNGLHLRDEKSGYLFRCHFNMIEEASASSGGSTEKL
jgi:radical SAM enzyme (rSAM/lipoprotein system)